MRKKPKTFNGPALLAAMFRELDPSFRKKLYTKLEAVSPIIAKLVEQLEFVYPDLLGLEDSGLQLVLRQFPEKDWFLAWKTTDEDLRKRLLENMSKTRRDEFIQQVQKQPRVPLAHVVRVQMQIAKTVREMLIQGKLRLKSRRPLPKKKAAKPLKYLKSS